MDDCALDATATGCADAWTSGFGIYPALEAAPAGDPAGSARAAARAPLRHTAAARPDGAARQGWRLSRSRRPAAGQGTSSADHEQDALPGIDIP
jgi:hypothetical protein